VDQSGAVLVLLAQTKDTTGAHRDARISYGRERAQPIIIAPRRDDLVHYLSRIGFLRKRTHLRVELPGRIQVMVISAQSRLLQSSRLTRRQHPQRRAHCPDITSIPTSNQ